MRGENKGAVNLEAKREDEERRKAEAFYSNEYDMGCTMLFPDEISGGTVSSTGSTGLIQIIPTTSEGLEFYEEVNSFRQKMPLVRENETDGD